MDPKVVETQVNENEEHQPLNFESQVVHGGIEEEVHSDNEKSVLKKVKAKAKKIKETFKKHGHHVLDHVHGSYNNNEDQHSIDDHHNLVQDEEETTENQGVDEPHVDENEAVRSGAPAPTSEKIDNLGKSGVNFGETKPMREEPSHDEPRVVDVSPTTETEQNIVTDSSKTLVGEEKPEQCKENGEEDPHVQGIRPEAYISPNYQTNVTDPIESGVDKIDIKPVTVEESSHQPRVVGVSPTTTEFDQNIVTDSAKALFVGEEKPEQGKVNLGNQTGMEEDPRLPECKTEAYTPHNFQTKANDPTRAGIDEIDMKPVEESFARMNVQDEPKSHPEPPIFADTQHLSAQSHDKFVPDLSSVSKTQMENPSAESHVHQHLPELSSSTKTQHEQFVTEVVSDSTEQTFNTTTTTVEEQPCQETVEKLANQNTNTDEILYAISDKAVPAENAKFGYGEKDDTENTHEEPNSEDASNKTGTAAEFGKNIAHSLTEKLTPVYDKVAGVVGSAVKSKVSGTRNGASTGTVGTETEIEVKKEQEKNKGVSSVKDYLAEKLRPSEEDRALSEIISGALNKRKEDPKKASGDEDSSDMSKLVPDSIDKQEEEIVCDEETNVNNTPTEGVVDKLKGVVGSWFSKSGENQSSHGGEDLSKNNKDITGEVEQVVGQAEGEKKL